MHTTIPTCMMANIQADRIAYTHTRIHILTRIQAARGDHTHTYKHPYRQTHRWRLTPASIYIYTCIRVSQGICTHTGTRTPAYRHTYLHTQRGFWALNHKRHTYSGTCIHTHIQTVPGHMHRPVDYIQKRTHTAIHTDSDTGI